MYIPGDPHERRELVKKCLYIYDDFCLRKFQKEYLKDFCESELIDIFDDIIGFVDDDIEDWSISELVYEICSEVTRKEDIIKFLIDYDWIEDYDNFFKEFVREFPRQSETLFKAPTFVDPNQLELFESSNG